MFTWRPDTGEIQQTFADQAAAEAWLSENFEALSDQGIGEVTLLDGETVVYGPMDLDPA